MYFRLPLRDLWLRHERGGGHIGRVIHLSISGHPGCLPWLEIESPRYWLNESGKLYRLELFFEGIEDDLQELMMKRRQDRICNR